MTEITIEQALENIYTSINADNQGLDLHIAALKKALAAKNTKTVEVDAQKLAQNNRQGRKMMQSYFKKRGVDVTFANVVVAAA